MHIALRPALQKTDRIVAIPFYADASDLPELPADFLRAVQVRLSFADKNAAFGDTLFINSNDIVLALICIGKKSEHSPIRARSYAALAVKNTRRFQTGTLALYFYPSATPTDIQHLAEGILLGNYNEKLFQTGTSAETASKQSLSTVSLLTDNLDRAHAAAILRGSAIGEAVNFARDLNNAPYNLVNPETLAEHTQKLAKTIPGVTCTIWDEKKLREKKMGGILAVGSGASVKPRLIRLDYKPRGAVGKPIILVGKGVCFDSGGYKLKPGQYIDDMFTDKMGAVTCIAVLKLIATLKIKKSVTVLIPAVGNLISGTSYMPGDIVTTYSGKTVEIANTDAEGRMILCDALSYACELKPGCIIDAASLTGACMIALGDRYGGLFTENEAMKSALLEAGKQTDDLLWPLPFHEDYASRVKATKADLQNWDTKTGGLFAGASIGAHFLREFVDPSIPWAHLDFLAPGYVKYPKPYDPVNATGYGVRLLAAFIEQYQQ